MLSVPPCASDDVLRNSVSGYPGEISPYIIFMLPMVGIRKTFLFVFDKRNVKLRFMFYVERLSLTKRTGICLEQKICALTDEIKSENAANLLKFKQ